MQMGSTTTLESLSGGSMSASMLQPLKKFYKGEPLALGITQIFIGVVEVAFGIVLDLLKRHNFFHIHLKTPHCIGILFIISGSLSVAAAKNPKMSMVKSMLAMNIVSAVAAGVGIVFAAIATAVERLPGVWGRDSMCSYASLNPEEIRICHETIAVPYAVTYGTVMALFTFTILEFGIAITTAAFGCATLCRNTYSETTIIIYQNAPPAFQTP